MPFTWIWRRRLLDAFTLEEVCEMAVVAWMQQQMNRVL